MEVRTRFAPSPTGYLHIGGARTALYSWLYARHHRGHFILRIEDTDRERSTDEAIQAILESMAWLGLDYDEGPYFQTKRFDRYREVIQQLLTSSSAYRCNCSKERLAALREEQMAEKKKPRYDGCCREKGLGADEPNCVIRFRNPKQGVVRFDDLVYVSITVSNSELDDLIIARSDGTPTYNFTVVVDDWDMQISHVIRGEDHINNTPRQINILLSLGAKLPVYAHLPMILGEDGKKLSKRHGAVGVMQFRDDGYLPHAVINYIAKLGWSYGDKEIFSRKALTQYFDLNKVNKSAAALNIEKLQWLNQHYMKTMDPEEVAEAFKWHLEQENIAYQQGPALTAVIKAQAERCKTLKEMATKSRFFYEDITSYDEKASKKHCKPEILPALCAVRDKLAALDDWSEGSIHEVVVATAEEHALKLGKLAQPIRIALSGGPISPPIDISIYLVGQKRTEARLSQVIEYIATAPPAQEIQ